MTDVETMQEAFAQQARACRTLGSEFSGRLLELLSTDERARAPIADLLGDFTLPPLSSAVALRVLGGLNALVLAEQAPVLAAFYPGAGRGTPASDVVESDDLLAMALLVTLRQHMGFMREFVTRPVQTNEVQRSAVLAPGFLFIAERFGLPLAMLEIGASGGLNMLWDRFAYRLGDVDWGPDDAPLTLTPEWRGPACALPAEVVVASRRGVDLHPLDFLDPAVVARGLAYIWPDQELRLQNFRAAVATLAASDVQVELADAGDWIGDALSEPAADVCASACTVVYHSIMWQYMPLETRARVEAAILERGDRATPRTPLAWLRFEPDDEIVAFELTVQVWPGDGTSSRQRLAWVHPHGASVHWLAEDDPDRIL